MDETVAAQQHIGTGEPVASQVEHPEPARRCCVPPFVLGDQRRHDVGSRVVDAGEVDVLQPGEIAARHVEQRLRTEIAKELW
jgi:hypothetical protein